MRRYPLVKTRYEKWRASFGEVAAPAHADAVLTDAALSGNRAIADAAGAFFLTSNVQITNLRDIPHSAFIRDEGTNFGT